MHVYFDIANKTKSKEREGLHRVQDRDSLGEGQGEVGRSCGSMWLYWQGPALLSG